MNGKHVSLIVAGLIAAVSVPAVDTEFWKPYKADKDTFYFNNFDSGNVPGKFGKGGKGGYKSGSDSLFMGSTIAMEAWLKLDKAPAEKAYAIYRPVKVTINNGFGLFVNPDRSFGANIGSISGSKIQVVSAAGLVPVGQWVHLAAISVKGRYIVLFLNGREVARKQLSSGQGINYRAKEKSGAAISGGGKLPGTLDEVRIHTKVGKLWPKPVALKVPVKVIPIKTILTPASKVLLYCSFNNTDKPQVEPAKLKIKAKGKYVDGVLGKAFRGSWNAYGKLVPADQGTLEFWSRPVGINNYSDRNVKIVGNNLFTLYIFNNTSTLRPLALYFRNTGKKLQFAIDKLNTDVYSGKWYHYVFRWDKNSVEYFIDGKPAGSTGADFSANFMKKLYFNPYNLFGDVDELYIYNNKLSDTEVMNIWYRYIDPAKVVKNPKGKVADLMFWHLPGKRLLYVKVKTLNPAFAKAPCKVIIADAAGKVMFSAPVKTSGDSQQFKLPEIPGGNYNIYLKSKIGETQKQKFYNQRFAWENNKLGLTNKIYPPFIPVKSSGDTVSVVLRQYKMNGFGLWNKAISKDREILAAPMRLVATDTNNRPLQWQCNLKRVNQDTYTATSECPAVKIDTTSKIECDGMMKVTMKLQKAAKPVKLKSLYLDIPLKGSIATLMHEDSVSHRRNFSGKLPENQGVIWDSTKSLRNGGWQNAFTGYIWLGGAERGLAWFAANDKGWYTQKNLKATLMQVIRKGNVVSLRIYLVNRPTLITKTTELTFGLQASPTRPMPQDVRTKGILLKGVGLSVHPWGGLSCSWKYPWKEHWEIVDKVAASRNGGKADKEFFETFQKKYNVPKVHGTRSWVQDCMYFSGKRSSTKAPDLVYFEEMNALTPGPEWHTFMDEWSASQLVEKNRPTMDIYRKNIMVNPSARINYADSYIDFGLYYMNEWMKRGVSPYWDNCYLKLLTNPWTSDAYVCENGKIQPASTIWRQREYMKRTWNLLNYWRKHQNTRPLDHVAHMTNTNLIPLFSWSTINYDIEMHQSSYANNFDVYNAGEPYAPEFLLAESTGLQVGAYPYLVHNVFLGQFKQPYEILGTRPGKVEAQIREWGMRMVHEIISGGPYCGDITVSGLNKSVYQFGYGTDKVRVWNYWGDTPGFKVTPDNVKGLLLTRAGDKKMLLVLQSWNKEPVEVKVEILPESIGFAPGKYVYDALNNRHLLMNGNMLKVNYQFPYSTGVYVISDKKPEQDVLFEDDFNAGLNPGWSYVSSYLKIKDGALYFDKNAASWCGPTRVFKTFDLPVYDNAELSFDFKIGKVPEKSADIVDVCFPGSGLDVSRHGLSHSYVKNGITLAIKAYPGKGLRLMAILRQKKVYKQLAWKYLKPLDAEKHNVRIVYNGLEYKVYMDGKKALKTAIPKLKADGFSFSANARKTLDSQIGSLRLDNIKLTAAKTDFSDIEQKRKRVIVNAENIMRAQSDELEKEVISVFGGRLGPGIYRLGLFRHPLQDAGELCQRIKSAGNKREKAVLIKLLGQLEVRKQEYTKAMKSIGQPLELLPEYDKAGKLAKDYLKK